MEKLFRNRITQEDATTMRKLKSTYIDMNDKMKTTNDTYDGLFLITLQPNSYVDDIKLEDDFRFILCLYYRWMYGTGWNKKHHLQFDWEGLIEQQAGNHNHIHFMIYEYDIEKLSIFLGYIKAIFKQLYPKASFNFERVYDVQGCKDYINPIHSKKDNYTLKKRENSFYLDSKMYQKPINNCRTLNCSI